MRKTKVTSVRNEEEKEKKVKEMRRKLERMNVWIWYVKELEDRWLSQ